MLVDALAGASADAGSIPAASIIIIIIFGSTKTSSTSPSAAEL